MQQVQFKRRLYVKLREIYRRGRSSEWFRDACSAEAEIAWRKRDSALRAALRDQLLEAAE